MPISDGQSKAERQYLLCKWYEQPGLRLRTREIAVKLGINEDTVLDYIKELSRSGRLPLRKEGQYWILAEDARLERLKVHLSKPGAVALYIAGRLLSQIHDERNQHVILALTQLVDALPEQLRAHQYALIEMAEQRQQKAEEEAGPEDRSPIFEALALGWINRCRVRLRYSPPRKRTFECRFAPYLLEPSAIGRTIYAIGESDPPGGLRTYKLERIEHAEVLEKETFTIPADFDGPALLSRAWGVMYGDEEPVEVRLRFSHQVTRRMKETLWHPSQHIDETSEGCVWRAQIGDITEIRPWLRGWGGDCEVLAPDILREEMIAEVRRQARVYGLANQQPKHSDTTDDEDFADLFGE